MANPLFQALGGQAQMNPMMQLIQDARQLRQSMTTNPKEEVQKLLNSGAMSQQKFNQLAQIAQQVVKFME